MVKTYEEVIKESLHTNGKGNTFKIITYKNECVKKIIVINCKFLFEHNCASLKYKCSSVIEKYYPVGHAIKMRSMLIYYKDPLGQDIEKITITNNKGKKVDYLICKK